MLCCHLFFTQFKIQNLLLYLCDSNKCAACRFLFQDFILHPLVLRLNSWEFQLFILPCNNITFNIVHEYLQIHMPTWVQTADSRFRRAMEISSQISILTAFFFQARFLVCSYALLSQLTRSYTELMSAICACFLDISS